MPYVAPEFHGSAFNCPHCNAYSAMSWGRTHADLAGLYRATGVHAALCSHCQAISYWLENEMLYPAQVTASMPHPDTPDHIKMEYEEARKVSAASPRSAAALLRLSIQRLAVHLGEPGQNLNTDIGNLVKKGLPPEIQQALDILRVIGNNAVHPGELSADDVASVTHSLFELHNQIIEDRISRPKKLKSLFEKLPAGARDAIANRDAK